MLKIAVIVAVGVVLAGCSTAGGSSGEQKAGGETHGGERTSVPDERPHIAGIVTEVKRVPGRESPPGKRILVEENPEGCSKSNTKEGCARLHLDVTEDTHIFRRIGNEEETLVRARVADLQRGQRIHAWHTGALTKSYPGQGHARVIVIDVTNAAASEHTADAGSLR